MREIKFRAWNKLFDTYFKDIENLIISGNGEIGIFEGNEWLGFGDYQDRFIIEQYTGLKDKNGVEIYENDVVMWRDGESVRYAQVVFTPDIKFLTHDYVFSYGRFAYKDTENHLTVIGNTHENADLLEEQ